MKIAFGQIYNEPGVAFPLSCDFQIYLGGILSRLTTSSQRFREVFGDDWDLVFRIDAKQNLIVPEVRGPTRYRRDKSVEFWILLPFDTIMKDDDPIKGAVEHLLDGVCQVFDKYGIDKTRLLKQKSKIVAKVCSDPSMIDEEW